jgi:hypothetical protein
VVKWIGIVITWIGIILASICAAASLWYSATAVDQSKQAHEFAKSEAAIAAAQREEDHAIAAAQREEDHAIAAAQREEDRATAAAQREEDRQVDVANLLKDQIRDSADLRGSYYLAESPTLKADSDVSYFDSRRLVGEPIVTPYWNGVVADYERTVDQEDRNSPSRFLFIVIHNQGLGGAQSIQLSDIVWQAKDGFTSPEGVMGESGEISLRALPFREFHALLVDVLELSTSTDADPLANAHFNLISALVEYVDVRGAHSLRVAEGDMFRAAIPLIEWGAIRSPFEMPTVLWTATPTGPPLVAESGQDISAAYLLRWEWIKAGLVVAKGLVLPMTAGAQPPETCTLILSWGVPIQKGLPPLQVLSPRETPCSQLMTEPYTNWLDTSEPHFLSQQFEWDLMRYPNIPAFQEVEIYRFNPFEQ